MNEFYDLRDQVISLRAALRRTMCAYEDVFKLYDRARERETWLQQRLAITEQTRDEFRRQRDELKKELRRQQRINNNRQKLNRWLLGQIKIMRQEAKRGARIPDYGKENDK